MRTLFAASAAAVICLAATPALAQSITDAEADAQLARMSTPAFNNCIAGDDAREAPAQQRYDACQTAMGELNAYRRANPRASAGEKQIHLFYEFAVEMGRTSSLLELHNPDMSKGCANIERQWVLAGQFNPAVVGPEMRKNLGEVTEAVRPLVTMCRENYPAPKGAPAA